MRRYIPIFAIAALVSCSQSTISTDIAAAQAKAAVVVADADQAAANGLPAVCALLSLANTAFALLVQNKDDATIEQGIYNGLVAPGAPCEPGATMTNAAALIPKVLVAVKQIQSAVKG